MESGCVARTLRQGRPKAPPATQNTSQKSSEGGKNKEVWGTEFKFGQLILKKLVKIATIDVIF